MSTKESARERSRERGESLEALLSLLESSSDLQISARRGLTVNLTPDIASAFLSVARTIKEFGGARIEAPRRTLTTQQAADCLGVSRQHLVDRLEAGDLPFHKVGTHRRVELHDLITYIKQRASSRKAVLDHLTKSVDEAGLYFPESAES